MFVGIFLVAIVIGILEFDLSTAHKNRWIIRCVIAVTSSLFMSVLIPSERTAYIMVGAYATQKVAEQPRTIELSNKVLKIIEKKLDDALVDVEKEAKSKIEPTK